MKFNYGSHVAWQIVGEEAVIIDLTTGTTIGLNPTATFIWSRLPSADLEQIAEELAQQFDPDADAATDVHALVTDLQNRNLISPAGP
jgi:hypothetical protein